MEINKLHCATGLDTMEEHGPVGTIQTDRHGLLAREAKQGTLPPPLTGQSTARVRARCCPGGSRGGEEPDPGCWRDKRSPAEAGDGEAVSSGADDSDSPNRR
jgi:hypothetical protein